MIGQCLPRHRHIEFLKFLRTIDREVPKGLQIHLILDNYSTHKHANVKTWLAMRSPGFGGGSEARCARGMTSSSGVRVPCGG